MAIQVSHRMSQELDCEIKVADVFVHATLNKLMLLQTEANEEFDFGVI